MSDPAEIRRTAGQCGLCAHALIRPTRKGTTYLRCARAMTDPAFPRYPRLPMTGCPGFSPSSP